VLWQPASILQLLCQALESGNRLLSDAFQSANWLFNRRYGTLQRRPTCDAVVVTAAGRGMQQRWCHGNGGCWFERKCVRCTRLLRVATACSPMPSSLQTGSSTDGMALFSADLHAAATTAACNKRWCQESFHVQKSVCRVSQALECGHRLRSDALRSANWLLNRRYGKQWLQRISTSDAAATRAAGSGRQPKMV
jgi:hypothetical protein